MNQVSKLKIDELIPVAIKTLQKLDFCDKDQKIPKTYHGYFSSFGADMICSSPLAAAIFAEESGKKESGNVSGTKEDKTLIPKAVLCLVSKNDFDNNKKLSEYIISHSNEGILSTEVLNNIQNAIIALKMAIRTFKKS